MVIRKYLPLLALIVLVVAAAVAGVLTRGTWEPWLFPARSAEQAKEGKPPEEIVRLSPQAQANLRLVVKPVQPGEHWRHMQMPGTVVELPGKSDRAVTAPVAGVVKRIAVYPWDRVRPGDELFTLELTSEYLQNSQTEFLKTSQELQTNQKERERLSKVSSVPAARLLELDYQQQMLQVVLQARRQDLATRGLTPPQIDAVAEGKFLKEMTIRVPGKPPDAKAALVTAPAPPAENGSAPLYEVQELKVNLGEQVQAGQLLCLLTDHQALYIEGHGFKSEVPLLERVAKEGWAVQAEFTEKADNSWKPLPEKLQVRFLANVIDAGSQTFPFYVPLTNQYHEYMSGGKTYRIWRFRPGQRVRLYVPVEKFEDVFVLPAEAVVREGAEAYVFRQNGDVFERRPVHVLHTDRRHVVLANDGSISQGNYIAHNGAAQLNFALKAQAAEGGGQHDKCGGH